MSSRHRSLSRLTAACGLLVGLAGCTDDPAAEPPPSSPPPDIAPAEQRLHFEWDEETDVPDAARDAVDLAREWRHAYNLWVTEPSTIPPYLEQHSGEELLGEIRSAAAGAPWTTGAVRAVLVETDVADQLVTLGVCEDRRDRSIIDAAEERVPGTGGEVASTRMRLVPADAGGWLVDHNGPAAQAGDADLRERCRELESDPPPSGSPSG